MCMSHRLLYFDQGANDCDQNHNANTLFGYHHGAYDVQISTKSSVT